MNTTTTTHIMEVGRHRGAMPYVSHPSIPTHDSSVELATIYQRLRYYDDTLNALQEYISSRADRFRELEVRIDSLSQQTDMKMENERVRTQVIEERLEHLAFECIKRIEMVPFEKTIRVEMDDLARRMEERVRAGYVTFNDTLTHLSEQIAMFNDKLEADRLDRISWFPRIVELENHANLVSSNFVKNADFLSLDDRVRADVEELERRIGGLLTSDGHTKAMLHNHEDGLRGLQDQISLLADQFAKRIELTAVEARLRGDVQHQLGELEQRMADSNVDRNRINNLAGRIADAERKLDEVSVDRIRIAQVPGRLVDIQSRLQEIDAELESERNRGSNSSNRLADIDARLSDALGDRNRVGAMAGRIGDLERKFDEYQAERGRVNTLPSRVAEIEARVQEIAQESARRPDVSGMDSKHREMKSLCEDAMRRIDQLAAEDGKHRSALGTLQADVDNMKAKRPDTQFAAVNEALTQLRAQLDSMEQNYNELRRLCQNGIEAMRDDLSSKERTLANIKREVLKNEGLSNEVNRIQQSLQQVLETPRPELDSALIGAKFDQVMNDVAALHHRIDLCNHDLNVARAAVIVPRPPSPIISPVKETIKETIRTDEALTGKVHELFARQNELHTRLNDVEGRVNLSTHCQLILDLLEIPLEVVRQSVLSADLQRRRAVLMESPVFAHLLIEIYRLQQAVKELAVMCGSMAEVTTTTHSKPPLFPPAPPVAVHAFQNSGPATPGQVAAASAAARSLSPFRTPPHHTHQASALVHAASSHSHFTDQTTVVNTPGGIRTNDPMTPGRNMRAARSLSPLIPNVW